MPEVQDLHSPYLEINWAISLGTFVARNDPAFIRGANAPFDGGYAFRVHFNLSCGYHRIELKVIHC
jgi:hypothetical protein